ncbi:MAG: viperin family antiviral radical SAM protein [Candidatus Fibromonas sp.]|jgi:radical S-adenosyl methionine domain-containing protein 2|nr:viperin family antiviral radical SAM protein [Candidatus Fibromonas sp.]
MQIVYNWHITERCNYSCEFCFAKWDKATEICGDYEKLEKILANLSQKEAISEFIGEDIASVRVNFAGGEPLILGKKFVEIVKRAKELGFETSLITNGFLLEYNLEIFKYLDIAGISIDSLDENICKSIGRCSRESYLSEQKLTGLVKEIRWNYPKIKLKFNIVVSEYNYNTNIVEQLQAFEPDRLKILRQLPFKDKKGITDEQFERFLSINEKFLKFENKVIENKSDIIQSYLMIDPQGRFFQNGNEYDYIYSEPIHKVGIKYALSQIPFSKEKFMSRYNQGGASNG